ncbi:putative FMNH2-utilizing oxygenase [Streptomyces ruber]|uniref:FMNH2-utilizing oxygenase n=2 Tax=Streptomyces TaxID=1883 RepID=A0A918BBE5_9ACTN|nr:LLM class flavin-dependent oxidoreductase [Streptomyces ruber]GGQ57197.1 putative FMNH2-utilizing oxygenase [Streptomyces ruber]
MTAPYGRGLLRLAAAVDQRAAHDVGAYAESARLAERGALDFVTLHDSLARPGPDALDVLARVAPATDRIGLVPTVPATHTEHFRVRAAVAELDRVSGGRAGWRIDVAASEGGTRAAGRRRTAAAEALRREAGEVADVAARLWDEPLPVDVDGGVSAVGGPAIVPRSPQGHPVRVVDATDRHARRVAARYADVALVQADGPERAGAVRDELRSAAAASGRDPGTPRVFAHLVVDLGGGEYAADPGHGGGGPRWTAHGPLYRGGPVDFAELITSWHRAGVVDGFHLVPAEPRRDLERLVNGTVALLQHRGLFRTFYPGRTLREHLGLARPAKRYAVGETGVTGAAS